MTARKVEKQANQSPREAGRQEDVQPGTGKKGKTWQSERPDPDSEDDKLEKALEDSFPASDPPAQSQPMATGWEVLDKEKKTKNGEVGRVIEASAYPFAPQPPLSTA